MRSLLTFHENENQLCEASRTMEKIRFRNLKDVSRFGIGHLKESFENIYCLMASHLNGNAKVNEQNMHNTLKINSKLAIVYSFVMFNRLASPIRMNLQER